MRRALLLALLTLCGCAAVTGLEVRPAFAATSPAGRPTMAPSGTAGDHGSTAGLPLASALVDIAATSTGRGYWLLAGDGGVFTFGDATYHGSTGDLALVSPARAMAATRSGQGYWFAAGDGGVFTFGDAGYHGSAAELALNKPVVGILPTETGGGYWLVASDGGVFTFGDAGFVGSLGGQAIPDPIVGLAPRPGGGYRLVDRVGRVYAFGASYLGGMQGACRGEVTDIASSPSGEGYWLLCSTGDVRARGDAPDLRPRLQLSAGQRAVGLATTPDGQGLWAMGSGVALAHVDETISGPHAFLAVSGGAPVRWSPCLPLSWALADDSPDGAEQLVGEAFDYLAGRTGLRFVFGGRMPAAAPMPVGTIRVGWTDLAPTQLGMATSRAHLTPWGPRMRSSDIALARDTGLALDYSTSGVGPVLLHELGHALGLDHVDDPSQLMYTARSGPTDFNAGDRAGLRQLSAFNGC
ncbi:MAG: hypothetical protein AVDCRST_MAG50-2519 [uncultured Acidimicrobiales bacterium]|uniref:Peptidase M10 metallopeptidase domain-containing protein n=1 Tax=uncultured Acidimicrobiales bacterium TaxID=310071 RepID=A0A6J4IDV9_9ACTN|nr:MAG: hypothetical protein AVDCRST_MAG50-2519 [uncultured Acidimicrobiales bacterium]